MKTLCITILLGLLNSINVFCQTTFDKRFNNDIFLEGPHTIKEQDYGFIILGHAGDFSQTDTLHPFFMKIDKKGNQIEYSTYDNHSCHLYAYGNIENDNNEIIIVGASNTAGDTCGLYIAEDIYSQRFRYYMHKIDSKGEVIWQKNYGDTNYLNTSFGGVKIIKSNINDNYLVMGAKEAKLAIMEITENGDTLSTKTYPTHPYNRYYRLDPVSDGYLCLMTNEYTKTAELFKLNNFLEHEWSIFHNGLSFRVNAETKDGGYIFSESASIGANKRTRLTKMDKEGNILWQQIYNNIISHYAVKESSDGNFIIAWQDIAKVDSLGNILWRKRLIPPEVDQFAFYNNVIETKDGGLLFVGRTKDLKIIVTKTDCEGNLTWDFDACPTYSTNDLFQIYPNPIGDNFTVAVPSSLSEGSYNFEMYDITGKKVKEVEFDNEISVPINTYSLSNGMYIYNIKDEDKVIQTGKVIKE